MFLGVFGSYYASLCVYAVSSCVCLDCAFCLYVYMAKTFSMWPKRHRSGWSTGWAKLVGPRQFQASQVHQAFWTLTGSRIMRCVHIGDTKRPLRVYALYSSRA